MTKLKALALAFGRASDAYASRNGIVRSEEWYMLKLSEELGELVQAWIKLNGQGRRNGASDAELRTSLADETADLLGHVLLFADRNDVDLVSAIRRKWLFDPEIASESGERV